MATIQRPRSRLAERITGDILGYLAAGPATRSMVVRDIVGSNEAVHGTLDELELAGSIMRRGKFLELPDSGRKRSRKGES